MINVLTPPPSLPLPPSQLRGYSRGGLQQEGSIYGGTYTVEDPQTREESARIQDWLGSVGRGNFRAASQRGRSWTPPLSSQLHGAGAGASASGTSMLASKDNMLYSSKQQYQHQQMPYSTNAVSSDHIPPVEQPVYQPSSPVRASRSAVLGESEKSASEPSNQIVSYLQIPPSINNSKGSLSEFAAQITCLFWFESSRTLHLVEESKTTPEPITPLVEEAKPCMGFRKWVTTMLSTTQVTQNVILLALLFIYRLKKQNPQVRGKAGSEYRLLTVALMLGNKFLDDNTYTNKTWADVSGISVSEIHVMEVEFLSNMRYNLYTSEREWEIWHRQLGRFWDYFDRASKAPVEAKSLPSLPYANGQMMSQAGQIALPSPPASQHTSPSFRSNESTYNYAGMTTNLSPNPAIAAPVMPAPIAQRMPDVDLQPGARKRSHEDSSDEPQAKRISRTYDIPFTQIMQQNQTPMLPMPNYPQLSAPPSNSSGTAYMHPYQNGPPAPQARAMSMVYGNGQTQIFPSEPNPSSHAQAQAHAQAHAHANGHAHHPSRIQIPSITSFHQSQPNLHTGHPTLPQPGHHATTGSPTNNINLTPTSQERLSPSGYTFLRSSPYRPVRSVNTLLVPPPSSSFQNPSLHVGSSSMHYQPLGRPPSERRTGVVPYVHGGQQYEHNTTWNVGANGAPPMLRRYV